MDKSLEQRIKNLEKKVAELESRVPEQPSIKEIVLEIKEEIEKSISTL